MAQVINCDAPGCTEKASVILSNIETGDTKAFCAVHFNEFVINYFQSLCEAQEAQQKAQEAEAAKNTAQEKKGRKGASNAGKKQQPESSTDEAKETNGLMEQDDAAGTQQEE